MNSYFRNIWALFMGQAPAWYKAAVIGALLLNPVLLFSFGPFVAGWAVLLEFLLVLALSLESYPLFPGGLLALELLVLRMVPADHAMKEIGANLNVIMLLIFLVPAIYFMRPLLTWIFMRLFASTRNKTLLSLIFLLAGGFLSAWLDALTVVAVMIAVCASAEEIHAAVSQKFKDDAEEFKGFLRNLLMHGAVGTALGGVATLIGEPQNLLIGHYAGWGFPDFYVNMARFSIPLQLAGIALCIVLEHFRLKVFGFGYELPVRVAKSLEEHSLKVADEGGARHKVQLAVMAVVFLGFMLALARQIAPIGIIGLGLLIVLPFLTGQTDEHKLGKAFEEPLPFTALLVVFFVIVAMIDVQGLFKPVTDLALRGSERGQMYGFFFASGILSAVSDNVFVASIYIHQAYSAFTQGLISQPQFDHLARVINLGTNIFSVATPNGQAAFLFLLTSALARRIGLSYLQMLRMSFPYAVVLILTAFLLI